MNRQQFLLNDLKINGTQSSWDWEADFRYACEFYPNDIERAKMIVYGGAPAGVRMSEHDRAMRHIKLSRLRALRALESKGLITSYWTGTGEGGRNFTGVCRERAYKIKTSTQF